MKNAKVEKHDLRVKLVITWDIHNNGKGKVSIENMGIKSYAKEKRWDFWWHDHFIGVKNMIKMCYLSEKRLKQYLKDNQ